DDPMISRRARGAAGNVEVAIRGRGKASALGDAAALLKVIHRVPRGAAVGAFADQPMVHVGVARGCRGSTSDDIEIAQRVSADALGPGAQRTRKLKRIHVGPGRAAVEAATDEPGAGGGGLAFDRRYDASVSDGKEAGGRMSKDPRPVTVRHNVHGRKRSAADTFANGPCLAPRKSSHSRNINIACCVRGNARDIAGSARSGAWNKFIHGGPGRAAVDAPPDVP